MLDLSPAEYLAPEQIRRAPATEKTDIYAFAAIVYGMLSGAPPFMAATRDAVIAKHLSEPRATHGPPTRVGLGRANRHASAREGIQSSGPGCTRCSTGSGKSRRCRRHTDAGGNARPLSAAGVALAASIAALGIWGRWDRGSRLFDRRRP